MESSIPEGMKRTLLFLAVQLHRNGKVSTERAAELAGLSVREFIRRLEEMGVAVEHNKNGARGGLPEDVVWI